MPCLVASVGVVGTVIHSRVNKTLLWATMTIDKVLTATCEMAISEQVAKSILQNET